MDAPIILTFSNMVQFKRDNPYFVIEQFFKHISRKVLLNTLCSISFKNLSVICNTKNYDFDSLKLELVAVCVCLYTYVCITNIQFD